MKTFENMGLSPEILTAIAEQGFVHPTPIQEKVIPAILESSQDIIGLAQTGTGKTAGFGLPIIQQIDLSLKTVQAIILCPTRELCLQITNDLTNFAKHSHQITMVAVYGGAQISNQIKALKQGVQIVIGTPGRTLDLIRRKVLKIGTVRWVVLDEADEMLNMGFREDMDAILAVTPKEKQVLLFSATMPAGVRQIAENYMKDPVEILAGKKNSSADNVVHHVYHVKAVNRFQALKRIIDIHSDLYGIVFCRTRLETRDLADKLTREGYPADALHGDLSQAQRDQVMHRFRRKQILFLIATDVAARGIDVTDLTHIINYSLPDDPEIYIHRSGRTGRAGKTGISIILAHAHDGGHIRQLEKLTGKQFQPQIIPSGEQILAKKMMEIADKIEQVKIREDRIKPFFPAVFERLNHLDSKELIGRFVTLELDKDLGNSYDTDDINLTADKSRSFEKRNDAVDFVRFHINLGKKHDISPNRLMGLINEHMHERRLRIGKIEIFSSFSFFEVEKEFSPELARAFDNAFYDGIKLIIQNSRPSAHANDHPRGGFERKERNFSKTRKNHAWKKGGRKKSQYR